MSLLNQKTIKNSVSFSGIGLHSGKPVKICVKPSSPDTGIVFKRVDLKDNNLIYPNFMNVSNTALNTTISNSNGVKVSTIEHLMGALFGIGIDNALIEIDNEEVPILDGSAKLYVNEILKNGIDISEAPIKVIRINKNVELISGEKSISIGPSKVNLEIDFELIYQNELINTQRNILRVYEDDLSDTFNSRTFCLYEDIEKLRSAGLAKGGSLNNAIVVDKNSILNKEGLRNDKEFVNHKILDCMGDLFLSGYKIIGSIKCSQGGHSLTNKLLRKIFSNKSNYSLIEIKGKYLPHTFANYQDLKSIA